MIPFSSHNTASMDRPNNRHRLNLYRRFMHVDHFGDVNALDIGAENFIGKALGIKDNTWGDLNEGIHAKRFDYDVVCCFEVINHIMNPLSFVREMRLRLKSGGTLYLSTPLLWLIPWYHGPENFSEYKRDKLEQLFRYAGFVVVRYEVKNPWPLRFIFYGIRPPFRYLFNRYQIWELRKP